jgi:hypothetical protein
MAAKRRSYTALELAVAFALIASFLCVAIPSFVRDLHFSYMVEPVDGVHRMAKSALAFSATQAQTTSAALPEGVTAPPPSALLPGTAPLTPPDVPRGVLREDPNGTWDHPTWKTLSFRASRQGEPHAYSFAFDNQGTRFSAVSRGDLDGDGVQSLFEVQGTVASVGGIEGKLEPGLYVEAEYE